MSFLVYVVIFCLKKERKGNIKLKKYFFLVFLFFIIVFNCFFLLFFFVFLWLIKIVESIVMI